MVFGPVQIRSRDPLRNFQFRVYVDVDGRSVKVAGVQRVSGLSTTVATFEVWEGGNNLHRYANPDKVTWDPITLEQGIALDQTLELWADAVRYFAMSGRIKAGSGQAVKRNVTIELWEASNVAAFAGPPLQPARRFRIQNAWISKYAALPKLDALSAEITLVSVELIHEGWVVERLDQNVGPMPSLP